MTPREAAASPSMQGPTNSEARKALRSSPTASPSMLGFSPTEQTAGDGAEPPALELPTALVSSVDGVAFSNGKVPVHAPVPEAPPVFHTKSLISDASGIGADEAYSKDENALNGFLKLHPSTLH